MSLKSKLLLLLVLVSTAILTGYAVEVLRDFRRDKQVYVFDSALLHVRGLADLVGVEVTTGLNQSRAVFAYFSVTKAQFLPQAQARLREESNVEGLEVYRLDDSTGPLLIASVYRDPKKFPGGTVKPSGDLRVERWDRRPDGWALSAPIKSDHNEALVAVTYFTKGFFVAAFRDSKILNNFLVGKDSFVLEPPAAARAVSSVAIQEAVRSMKERPNLDSGVFEAENSNAEALLVSYASVGAGDLQVVSAIPVQQAMQTANLVVKKSWYFWLMLVCLSIFIAVLGAAGVTANLKRLHFAVGRFGQGELEVSIPSPGHDEIGDLGRGFNDMTARIRALIAETAVKTRMQEELKTAQLVQNTIFPPDSAHEGRVRLKGTFTPANECSGDLWVYSRSEDFIYVGIADATGHGAAAALMTSAARSAYSVLSRMADLSVGQRMAGLNRATFDTAKSQMQMTATLASIQVESGEARIAVASHEPTCILRARRRPLARRDIEFPKCEPGHRLGDHPDASYPEAMVQLEPGDVLFFYTDGLTEMRNLDGEMLGERRVFQRLIESFNDKRSIAAMAEDMSELGRTFRGEAELQDDVTFVVVEFGSDVA